VNGIAHSHIKKAGYRLHRVYYEATCAPTAWRAFRSLAAAENKEGYYQEVLLEPVAPDLNENHAVFSSLVLGARWVPRARPLWIDEARHHPAPLVAGMAAPCAVLPRGRHGRRRGWGGIQGGVTCALRGFGRRRHPVPE